MFKYKKILFLTFLAGLAGIFSLPKSASSMGSISLAVSPNSFVAGSVNQITLSGDFRGEIWQSNCPGQPDPSHIGVGLYPLEVTGNITYTIGGTSKSGTTNSYTRIQTGTSYPCGTVTGTPNSYKDNQYRFVNNPTIDVSGLGPGNYQVFFTTFESNQQCCTGATYSNAPGPTFTITAASNTINVTSNLSTCWGISGTGSFSDCGTSKTYSPVSDGSYSLTADDQTCYDKSITPSATQSVSGGGTITFTITYTAQPGCGNPPPPPGGLTCSPGSQSAQTGQTMTFTASGGNGTYSWSAPSSSPSSGSGSSFTVSYGATGSYTVTVTSGGSSTSCTANVGSPPVGAPVCSPAGQTAQVNQALTYTATGGNGTYSWTAPGGSPSSGSGSSFSVSYGSAGDYTITVGSGGFTGSCTAHVTVSASCTDNSTITPSPVNLGNLSPGATASFSMHVVDSGDTRWYHGSAYQLVQNTGQNIISTSPANVAGLNYGHLPYGAWPGDYLDWGFNVTAPNTPGTYTVSMQMIHYAGWQYMKADGTTCPAPSSNIKFGAIGTVTFTVVSVPPSTIAFTIKYSPAPLNPPTGVAVDNSTCSKITISWSYSDNGTGNGFYVYRSTDDTTWTAITGLLPVATRSYQDTPPLVNQVYYYRVSSHRGVAGSPTEVYSVPPDPSALNRPCVSDLSLSSKTLLSVQKGGSGAFNTYTSSTTLNDGDVLRFRITISNTGSSAATINYIDDTLTSNLLNPRNLRIDRNGNGTYNESGETGSISGAAPNIRITIGGSKPAGNPNWLVEFDTTLTSQTTSKLESIKNIGVINYTDPQGTKTKTVQWGPILYKTSAPSVPQFREVAP